MKSYFRIRELTAVGSKRLYRYDEKTGVCENKQGTGLPLYITLRAQVSAQRLTDM